MYTSKTYAETVEGMVKKRNATRDEREFFDSLLLLKNPALHRKYPELREPHAICIYCAHVAPERTFSKLMAAVTIPIEGGVKLRHGVCEKCGVNTSNMKK